MITFDTTLKDVPLRIKIKSFRASVDATKEDPGTTDEIDFDVFLKTEFGEVPLQAEIQNLLSDEIIEAAYLEMYEYMNAKNMEAISERIV